MPRGRAHTPILGEPAIYGRDWGEPAAQSGGFAAAPPAGESARVLASGKEIPGRRPPIATAGAARLGVLGYASPL
jgi:hypothetical protein